MENIIKNNITEILVKLKTSYSKEQEACILQIMDILSQNNINISKLSPESLSMFVNHLLVLFSRLEQKEILEMESLDIMFAELKKESIEISKKITKIVKTLYDEVISEAEIFLIATHVENILNQRI